MISSDSSLPRTGEDSASSRSRLPPGVAANRGILHCRRGEWHSGLYYLLQVEADTTGDVTMPGIYYSYLGLALSKCHRRHAEAIELCERAVALGFFDPENFLNLGWVRTLSGDRRGALEAVERGLLLDPKHAALGDLKKRLGTRRPPVLSFLPRQHPLNVRLGRWRHALSERKAG